MPGMGKDIFVSQLKVKDNVDSIFLVKYIALMEGRDGRSYLNMVAADNSGDLECRLWTRVHEIHQQIKKGGFARIKGKVNQYQGRKQLVIQELYPVAALDVNEADFVVKSQQSPEGMYARLLDIVDTLDDVYIKDLLLLVLHDSEIKRRLLIWPAGKSIHHAYQSGLLEHILSCTELALILSAHYRVNFNYVVAGTILHDLGKIYELSDGPVTDYTEEGKLVGHMAKVLEVMDRFCYRIKNFPYPLKVHLKHIILAHHGEYEYGSPKIPQTSEALLVHLIDFLDSKMNSVETIKKLDTTPGHWSAFVKHLDRVIYKGELPYYPEYIVVENSSAEEGSDTNDKNDRKEKNEKTVSSLSRPHSQTQSSPASSAPSTPHRHSTPKELKQNLGKLLQGFKVEEN